MKIVIVNCFDTYEDRIKLIHEFFDQKNNHITILQSNFKHIKKVKHTEKRKNYIYVNAKPYYKNISLRRLISHYVLAKDIFKTVKKIEPDLVYAIIPANSVTKFAAKYKKKNDNTILIFDIMDLWPETMPIGKIKMFPPFTFWKHIRDKHLKYADYIITECNLYQSIMENVLHSDKTETVYLAQKENNIKSHPIIDNDNINLCYLGSINNIIDIKKIKELVTSIQKLKPTTFHIIGDGESKKLLINEIVGTGAIVEDHGKIYSFQEKQNIFDKCQFGVNIMKDSVTVGLTMKSINYFQHGIPIINNIPADTNKLVKDYNIGFNLTNNNIEEIAFKISNIKDSELHEMRKNTQSVFSRLFSQTSFEKKLKNIVQEKLKLKGYV